MPQLSGALHGIGLPALLRFLAELGATGRLRVAAEPWTGEVAIERGHVVAAAFGPERGLVALEAMLLTPAAGTFQVTDEALPDGRDEQLTTMPVAEIAAHREQVDHEHSAATTVLLSPTAHFSVSESADGNTAEEVVLTRRAMGVLLAIRDGQQTLVRLAEQWGLFPAIQALTELSRLGLIRIEMAPEPGVSGTAASHEQGAPHANRASPGSPALP